MSRCTGHCCRRITISQYPEDLRKAYVAWHKGKKYYWSKSRNKKKIPKDIHLVYPMLKLIGWSPTHAASGKRQKFVEPDGKTPLWPVYTCKHYDNKTNNCTIYKQRPKMCSSYPDGGVCKFKGCTA